MNDYYYKARVGIQTRSCNPRQALFLLLSSHPRLEHPGVFYVSAGDNAAIEIIVNINDCSLYL